jgi:hypothetical protein
MSLEDVRMYSELDAVLALDYEISVGVVVFRMVGSFWQGHFKSCVRLKMRVEESMRWREQSRDHGRQGSEWLMVYHTHLLAPRQRQGTWRPS